MGPSKITSSITIFRWGPVSDAPVVRSGGGQDGAHNVFVFRSVCAAHAAASRSEPAARRMIASHGVRRTMPENIGYRESNRKTVTRRTRTRCW